VAAVSLQGADGVPEDTFFGVAGFQASCLELGGCVPIPGDPFVLIEGADDESTESVVAQEPTDPTAAGTGGGVDGNRYVSPDYGWSLDWDGAAWAEDSVSNELELVAVGEGEGPDGLGRVRFQGIEGYDGDAAACLSAIAEVFDQELPEVTEEGGRAFATTEPYLATEDLDGDGTIGAEGEAVAARMYLECRPLGTDGNLLGISFSDRADRFAERFPAVEALVASVEMSAVAESAAPNSTAPTAPTGSPAEPPVSSTPSDAYASDAFDFALTWDPGRWELLQERNDDGTERLVLSDGTSTVDLYPFRPDNPDMTPRECVGGFADIYAGLDGAGEAEAVANQCGHGITGFSERQAHVVYRFVGAEGGNVVRHIECRRLGEGELLLIAQRLPSDAYDASSDAAREDLLAGLTVAADRADELPGRLDPMTGAANQHVDPGEPHAPYATAPPTSGAHFQEWAPWGVHDDPIPDGNQIHNLEHGGVLLQYSCDCPEVVALLQRFADPATGYPVLVIAAPYPEMEADVALTAWERTLELDEEEVTEETVCEFVEAYIDRGPEKVHSEELSAWWDPVALP
jgi:hypothetical protein